MSNFNAKVNAFFYKNRDRGIPNLMLYIAIGNVVVYVLSMLNRQNPLFYNLLCFDYAEIVTNLQLWRLVTYPLTYLMDSTLLFGIIGLLFYFYCGKVIEANWGTLRFNCYYLAGILLTDVAGILIGLINGASYPVSSSYLNLSLFLAVATLQPDAMVRVCFIIPVKMKWLAWLELGLTVYEVISLLLVYGVLRFVWILPVFALLNYFLFFGKNFINVLPDFMRFHPKRQTRPQARSYAQAGRYNSPVREARPCRFRCTVCGRTDVSNPELEFRYCSRCAGYRCYCMDHINNHAHITE